MKSFIHSFANGMKEYFKCTYVGLLLKPAEELHDFREVIRKKCIGADIDTLRKMNRITEMIDEISDNRSSVGDSLTEGFPFHKEHGWYLPDDD